MKRNFDRLCGDQAGKPAARRQMVELRHVYVTAERRPRVRRVKAMRCVFDTCDVFPGRRCMRARVHEQPAAVFESKRQPREKVALRDVEPGSRPVDGRGRNGIHAVGAGRDCIVVVAE